MQQLNIWETIIIWHADNIECLLRYLQYEKVSSGRLIELGTTDCNSISNMRSLVYYIICINI